MTKQNLNDTIDQANKDYGGSDFFKFEEGNNEMRILTPFHVYAEHYSPSGYKGVCLGKENDCGGCEEGTKPTAKWLAWGVNKDGLKLFKFGHKIIKQVLNTNAFVENSRSLGQLLSKTEKHPELDLVYLVVNNNDFEEWHKSDLENLVLAINTVGDCRWALILIEYEEGKTKASLRSEEYKGVDVSKIASLFGGGGHKFASGFQVDDKPEKVLEQVVERARKIIV